MIGGKSMMRKIASPDELVSELRGLLVRASEPNPSRVRIAAQLNQLAHRVAATEGFRVHVVWDPPWADLRRPGSVRPHVLGSGPLPKGIA